MAKAAWFVAHRPGWLGRSVEAGMHAQAVEEGCLLAGSHGALSLHPNRTQNRQRTTACPQASLFISPGGPLSKDFTPPK